MPNESVEGTVKANYEIDTGQADKALENTETQAKKTEQELENVKKKEQETQIESIAMLTALTAVSQGTIGVMNSLGQLIPMTDETRAEFQKATAAIQLFVSTCTLLKGAAKLFDLLSLSMIKSAIASLSAAAAANPILAIAGVAAISATAGAAAGYFLAQDNRVTNNITVLPDEVPVYRQTSVNTTGAWD